MSEGKILVVNPNLPMPPGTDSSDPSNPKATIKGLRMVGAQASTDAHFDPPPRREGFQSPPSNYTSLFYIFLTIILLFFVFRKHPRYGFLFFIVVLLLAYLDRYRNRTV